MVHLPYEVERTLMNFSEMHFHAHFFSRADRPGTLDIGDIGALSFVQLSPGG